MTFTVKKRLFSAALFLLLVDSNIVRAEVHNTTRLEPIKKFEDKDNMVCLRPLSRNPGEDLVVARLMVQSTARSNTFPAGNSTLDKLTPNSWHYVSIKQVEDNYVHILKVEVNGQTIAFSKAKDPFWVSAFKFKEVLLLSKGTVQVTNCPPPEDPTTTTKATTTATTKATTTATTKATTTATTTATTKATTKDTMKATTTTTVTEIADVSTGGNEWWRFMYCLGDIYGFPIVGVIIISVIVGLSICILIIIMCKRRCRCCQENDPKKRRESSWQFQRLGSRVDEVDMEFSPNSPDVTHVINSNQTPVFSSSTYAGPVTYDVTDCEFYSSPHGVRRDMQRVDSQGYFSYNTLERRPLQSSFLPIDQLNQGNDSCNEFPEYTETIYT